MLTHLIIDRRKALKVSQKELAALLGLQRETFNRKEKNGTFSLAEAEIICKRLDIVPVFIYKEQLPEGIISKPSTPSFSIQNRKRDGERV